MTETEALKSCNGTSGKPLRPAADLRYSFLMQAESSCCRRVFSCGHMAQHFPRVVHPDSPVYSQYEGMSYAGGSGASWQSVMVWVPR